VLAATCQASYSSQDGIIATQRPCVGGKTANRQRPSPRPLDTERQFAIVNLVQQLAHAVNAGTELVDTVKFALIVGKSQRFRNDRRFQSPYNRGLAVKIRRLLKHFRKKLPLVGRESSKGANFCSKTVSASSIALISASVKFKWGDFWLMIQYSLCKQLSWQRQAEENRIPYPLADARQYPPSTCSVRLRPGCIHSHGVGLAANCERPTVMPHQRRPHAQSASLWASHCTTAHKVSCPHGGQPPPPANPRPTRSPRPPPPLRGIRPGQR